MKEKNFYGFVWETSKGEGLHCIAYELAHSHGAQILNANGQFLNNSDNINALTASLINARRWIDEIDISPSKEITDTQVLEIWKDRRALFMRHWPVAYTLSTSSQNYTPEEIGISVLPVDNSEFAKHASTLGGWQLMVNKNSDRKRKKVAKDFVHYLAVDYKNKIANLDNLSAPESLTKDLGKLPAIKEIYANDDILKGLPDIFRREKSERFKKYQHIDQIFKPFSQSKEIEIVQRPSRENYSALSEQFQKRIYNILSNSEFKNNESKIKKEVVDLLSDMSSLPVE